MEGVWADEALRTAHASAQDVEKDTRSVAKTTKEEKKYHVFLPPNGDSFLLSAIIVRVRCVDFFPQNGSPQTGR